MTSESTPVAHSGSHSGSHADATLVGTHDHRATGEVGRAELRIARGDAIGRYLAVQLIGRGANGVVWSAYDGDLDRRVAIKLLAQRVDERGDRRRTQLAEAQAMAKIRHPNVVAVYDVGTHADHLYIAMEFVEGSTLGLWCKQAARTRDEILEAYTAAARGLADAHRAGVVHRDFKPENVLVDREGRVRVADFGLAASLSTADGDASSRASRDRAASGTPAYMSPEHHAGTVDARSDQFSFCIALCEALTTRRPFVGATLAELAAATVRGVLDPGVTQRLPSRVRGVVLRGLAPVPTDRFASMDALVLALERARRPRWPWVLGATLTLCIAGAAWFAAGNMASPGECPRGTDRVAEVWTKTQRSQIRVVPGEYTRAYADAIAEHLGAELDAYATRWADTHDRNCAAVGAAVGATMLASSSDPTTVARRACVENRLASFTGAVALVTTREIEVDATDRLLQALPDPAACERDDVVAWEPVPPDPELAARVASIRRQLSDITLRRVAGEPTVTLEDANAVLTAARETAYPHLVARALVEVSNFEDLVGRPDDARRHFDEATELALAAGHDWLAATIAIERIEYLSHNPSHDDGGKTWELLGRAMIARSGGDDRLVSRLHTALGGLSFRRNDFQAAIGHHEAALAALVRTVPRDERSIGIAHLHCALALAHLNRRAEAQDHAEKGRGLLESLGGPTDRDLLHTLHLFAVLASQLRLADEAIAHFNEALERAEALYGPRSRLRSVITFNLAYIQASQGQVSEARTNLALSRRAWPVEKDAYSDGEFELAEHAIDYMEGDAAGAIVHLDRAIDLWSRGGDAHARSVASARLSRARILVLLGEHQAALAIAESEYRRWGPSLFIAPEDAIDAVLAARGSGDASALALWLARSEAMPGFDAVGVAQQSFARALAWDHPDPATLDAVRRARADLAVWYFDGHPLVRQIDAWLAQAARNATQ